MSTQLVGAGGDFACRDWIRLRGKSSGRCVVSMRIEKVPRNCPGMTEHPVFSIQPEDRLGRITAYAVPEGRSVSR
jgi:hypothetical protein